MEYLLFCLTVLNFIYIILCDIENLKYKKRISKNIKDIKRNQTYIFNYLDSIYEDIERVNRYENEKECK